MNIIKTFLELIFIKQFIGWVLSSVILFLIMTILSLNSIEIRLIIIALIFAFGSLIYSWKQMTELYKSPNLVLYLKEQKNDKLYKEISTPTNQNIILQVIANNEGTKIADKFSIQLEHKEIPGIISNPHREFHKYVVERNGQNFYRYENRPRYEYYIFPGSSHLIGAIMIRYKNKEIANNFRFKINCKVMANDMNIKKGDLIINFIQKT